MTFLEYKKYQRAVENFFKTEGIENLSDKDECAEPSFSHRPCECCKRPLGGDRFTMTGFHKELNEIFEFEVCPDCRYYSEYGQLDDMTMMDMAQETKEARIQAELKKKDSWATEPAWFKI